jgi:hypothetical protein
MPRTTLRGAGASLMDALPDNAERMLRLARARESQQPVDGDGAVQDEPADVEAHVDPYAFPNSPPNGVQPQEVEEDEEGDAEEAGETEEEEDDDDDETADHVLDTAVVDGPMAADADAESLRADEAAADEDAVQAAAQEEVAAIAARVVPLSAEQARNLVRVPVRHGGKGAKRRKVLRDNIRTRHSNSNTAPPSIS